MKKRLVGGFDKKRSNPWKTLGSRVVFANPWIRVLENDVINPAGNRSLYGVVQFQNVAVGVVALDERDRLLMVGQHRYPFGSYSWEIPEGGCPKGSSLLSAAKRELKEETGYRASTWKKILTMHLSNSVTDEKAVVFMASGLKAGKAEPEETEEIETKWVSFKRAVKMIQRGEITDAISVAAILHVNLLRRERASHAR
jgi:8-oxo-dGTP pyrophosphatase MutT (NUDIX family)